MKTLGILTQSKANHVVVTVDDDYVVAVDVAIDVDVDVLL